MIYCQTFADAGVMQIFKCHPTTCRCWTPSLSRCWVFGGVSCFSVLGSPFAPAHSIKRDSATRVTYRKCAQLHLKCKCRTFFFHKQSAGKHLHNRCAAYSLMWGQNKQNHAELELLGEETAEIGLSAEPQRNGRWHKAPHQQKNFPADAERCTSICVFVQYVRIYTGIDMLSKAKLTACWHCWRMDESWPVWRKGHMMFFAQLEVWRGVFGGDFWTWSRNQCKLRNDLIFICGEFK